VQSARRGYIITEEIRALNRSWIERIRADVKAGRLDRTAAEMHVRLASVLAVAKSLASGRFPNFWRRGVHARQAVIGADSDVTLSGRQVARVIGLLTDHGYIERTDQDRRRGRTCLLRPKMPIAERSDRPRNRV
jgi:hypothetical protein